MENKNCCFFLVAHVAVSITFNYVFVEAEKKEEDKDDGEIGFVSHGASWSQGIPKDDSVVPRSYKVGPYYC